MKPDPTPTPSIETALRLLRYERPPEGFEEDFLREFHRRQRVDSQRVSVWQLMRERVGAFFHDLIDPKWAYAAGAAYIAVMTTLYIHPASKPTSSTEVAAAVERARARGEAVLARGPYTGPGAYAVSSQPQPMPMTGGPVMTSAHTGAPMGSPAMPGTLRRTVGGGTALPVTFTTVSPGIPILQPNARPTGEATPAAPPANGTVIILVK
jgi:hypothetical protein